MMQFRQTILVSSDCAQSEDFQHFYNGKHMGYSGRAYRRGKNRCKFCGAPNDAPDAKDWVLRQREYMMADIFKECFGGER